MRKLTEEGLAMGFSADGNRRWAKGEGCSILEGHQAGFRALNEELLTTLLEHNNWDTLAVHLFSPQNLNRPPQQVQDLLNLFPKILDHWEQRFKDDLIQFRHAGDKEGLPSDLAEQLGHLEEVTKAYTRFRVVAGINYGGQEELARAIQKGGVQFEQFLEVPPIDLFLRTGGEQRTSNFAPYQLSFAELAFTGTLLPDLTREEVLDVLDDFDRRERRRGK